MTSHDDIQVKRFKPAPAGFGWEDGHLTPIECPEEFGSMPKFTEAEAERLRSCVKLVAGFHFVEEGRTEQSRDLRFKALVAELIGPTFVSSKSVAEAGRAVGVSRNAIGNYRLAVRKRLRKLRPRGDADAANPNEGGAKPNTPSLYGDCTYSPDTTAPKEAK